MNADISAKPAAADTACGLREYDQLGGPIDSKATHDSRTAQPDSHQVASRARLEFLAGQIYRLGPYPLFHLLAEIIDGAAPLSRIERYALLNQSHGDFVRAIGGDQFPSRLFLVEGKDSND